MNGFCAPVLFLALLYWNTGFAQSRCEALISQDSTSHRLQSLAKLYVEIQRTSSTDASAKKYLGDELSQIFAVDKGAHAQFQKWVHAEIKRANPSDRKADLIKRDLSKAFPIVPATEERESWGVPTFSGCGNFIYRYDGDRNGLLTDVRSNTSKVLTKFGDVTFLDEKTYLSKTENNAFELFDLNTHTRIQSYISITGKFPLVSPKGRFLVDVEKSLIYDLKKGLQYPVEIDANLQTLIDAFFTPDEKFLVLRPKWDSRLLSLVDAQTGKTQFKQHFVQSFWIKDLDSNRFTITTEQLDKKTWHWKLWDIQSGQEVNSIIYKGDFSPPLYLSEDAKSLIVHEIENDIQYYNLTRGVWEKNNSENFKNGFWVSRSQKFIARPDKAQSKIALFETAGFSKINVIDIEDIAANDKANWIHSVKFSIDDRYLFVTTHQQTLGVYEIASGKLVYKDQASLVSFSSDGSRVLISRKKNNQDPESMTVYKLLKIRNAKDNQ